MEELKNETTIEATDPSDLENGIVEAVKTVFDPEIPVNIYELGLIYDIDIQEGGAVHVKMTLTSPGCPVAGSLPIEVKEKVEGVPGVASAEVELVWDPTWNPSMMSEAARLTLGMF
jgi:FeS assembly SUF system protein